jgi:hypothetical protein
VPAVRRNRRRGLVRDPRAGRPGLGGIRGRRAPAADLGRNVLAEERRRAADAQKTPPTTRLLQTPAGHILQFDDEDSKEHIRLHHAGGAELLIDENGTISITDQAGNTITLDAGQEQISIADTNDNAITMSATGVKIEDGNDNSIEFAPSGVTISSAAQIVLDAKIVQLGGAGGEPVIKGASFLTLFATHVHTAAGPGSPTTPPLPQGEPTTLSTTVLTK